MVRERPLLDVVEVRHPVALGLLPLLKEEQEPRGQLLGLQGEENLNVGDVLREVDHCSVQYLIKDIIIY